MKSRRLPTMSLLTPLLVAAVALFFMPTSATAIGSDAYDQALSPVTIALTSEGIVAPSSSLTPGDHLLTIVNNTSEPRGLEMTGTDLVVSPTVRYTKVLQPGESETFRWFFASGKGVYLRDITRCGHAQMTCMLVSFGPFSKSVEVD